MTATTHPLRKALLANSTAASFTAKIPVADKPENDGVFNIYDSKYGAAIMPRGPKYLHVIPYGTDTDDETLSVRVWAWSEVVNQGLWVPQLLTELLVTVGAIDGAVIGAGVKMADTIVVTYGDAAAEGLGVYPISPANDVTASAIVHLRGAHLIEFDFKKGTAVAMNAYWRVVDQN